MFPVAIQQISMPEKLNCFRHGFFQSPFSSPFHVLVSSLKVKWKGTVLCFWGHYWRYFSMLESIPYYIRPTTEVIMWRLDSFSAYWFYYTQAKVYRLHILDINTTINCTNICFEYYSWICRKSSFVSNGWSQFVQLGGTWTNRILFCQCKSQHACPLIHWSCILHASVLQNGFLRCSRPSS